MPNHRLTPLGSSSRSFIYTWIQLATTEIFPESVSIRNVRWTQRVRTRRPRFTKRLLENGWDRIQICAAASIIDSPCHPTAEQTMILNQILVAKAAFFNFSNMKQLLPASNSLVIQILSLRKRRGIQCEVKNNASGGNWVVHTGQFVIYYGNYEMSNIEWGHRHRSFVQNKLKEAIKVFPKSEPSDTPKASEMKTFSGIVLQFREA